MIVSPLNLVFVPAIHTSSEFSYFIGLISEAYVWVEHLLCMWIIGDDKLNAYPFEDI